MFIANRIALEQTENFFRVRIRADEPLQARQLKSKLRRAVYTARKDGMRARFLSDEEMLMEGKKHNKGNIDTHLEKQDGEKCNGMPLSNQNKDRGLEVIVLEPHEDWPSLVTGAYLVASIDDL